MGYLKKDIILLSPKKEVGVLSGSDVLLPGDFKVEIYSHKSIELRYSTIHSFKGLESEVVIILGIDSVDDKIRNLLYVAISRATSQVFLFLKKGIKPFFKI